MVRTLTHLVECYTSFRLHQHSPCLCFPLSHRDRHRNRKHHQHHHIGIMLVGMSHVQHPQNICAAEPPYYRRDWAGSFMKFVVSALRHASKQTIVGPASE